MAYSELPDWADLMLKFAERMPARKTLIDRFVFGKQPTLRQMDLDAGTTPLDTLWGFYFATGSTEPILRMAIDRAREYQAAVHHDDHPAGHGRDPRLCLRG